MKQFVSQERVINKVNKYSVGKISAQNVAVGNKPHASGDKKKSLPTLKDREGLMVNQRYDVGKVKAKNVAIGNRAKAGDRTYSDANKEDAIFQIRQLIELLSVHANEIDSPGEIQAYAESVETALQKRKLNRARIENLVHKIASAIAGVTVLANAVDAVQTAVSHLFT